MSLKEIRSECTGVASLLQPYIDGELEDDESERVASHLDACSPCRTAVSEQLWVRAALRAAPVEQAPQALRARILAALDEVDAQAKKGSASSTWWNRFGTRARALLRGGLIMVPAGAVAGMLFLVARGGLEQADVLPGGAMGAALASSELRSADLAEPVAEPEAPEMTRALAELEPKLGFPLQVARSASPQVQLVGARVDDNAPNAAGPGARLRYRVFREGRHTGDHIIDRQRPRNQVTGPVGTPVTFRGQRYLLGTGEHGEPVVHFERAGVLHMVHLEGGSGSGRPPQQDGSPDFSHLLDVAHHLAHAGF